MRTLICDLNVYDNGHHISYAYSITTFSSDRDDVLFLFNRDAAHWCPGLLDDKRVFFVDEKDLAGRTGNVFIGKLKEYRGIRQFAIEQSVDRVVLLEIDQYQAAIGLIRAPFKVTGIFFRPYHMIGVKGHSMATTMKNLAYRWKKVALFQLLRMNRRVEPLFLLNDRLASVHYPSYFKYLPDPIFHTPGDKIGTHRERIISYTPRFREDLGIAQEAHVFLVFGAISERKNIDNIASAYQQADLQGPSVLLIAGKVTNDYREEYNSAIRNFEDKNNDPQKKIVAIDEFIGDDQLDSFFHYSDTIVICYRKFYGSSGLMGKAAEHGKTCIVPDKGVLYDLCREYDLGYSADPLQIAAIAKTLEMSEQDPVRGAAHEKFVEEHSEDAFLNTLLR